MFLLAKRGHKLFVKKIRDKYGDDLFNLSVWENNHEVQTYKLTLTLKEKLEDSEYIK